MNITNITGITGNHNPNSEGEKKVLLLVSGFIAGLAITACPALLPIANGILLPQSTDLNFTPGCSGYAGRHNRFGVNKYEFKVSPLT